MARLSNVSPPANHLKRNLLFLVLFIGVLYVILPQLHSFRASFSLLRHMRYGEAVLAIGATILTYCAAAATYYFLALRPLRYGRTLLVELANLLVNRIVPAGVGGLGFNYQYLRSNKHSVGEAVSVVAVNNLLGFVGHTVLFVGLLGFLPNHDRQSFSLGKHLVSLAIIIGGVALVILVMSLVKRLRVSLGRAWHSAKQSLEFYIQRPQKVLFGLLSSMVLTSCTALSFGLCCRALGVDISLLQTFLIFTLSVVIGTATPTPGGLGGVEASLVAGLIAAKVDSSAALSAVLLYRLISYWLPLVVGGGALVIVQKRRYVRWDLATKTK